MAQIPDTFKLFNQTWRINTTNHKELPNELGMCYTDQQEIVLLAGMNSDVLIQTLIHELVHAIETKLDLDMTERQVDLMALGLIDLFRSNPNMLSLLAEQD